uniref:Myosin phosphatase Rho-interacting protein n=2 Tax=Sus scrofa TaxID=9823 RepID=A0A8D2CFS0_PIG
MSAAKENPCRKFQANIFNKSKCQNCFKPRESHLLNDEDLTQAKPIYGGWLLLAPDGTDFDNPVHRSRKWQRRFFVLYEHGLLRYALDEMPTTLPQGTINMNQCSDVVDGEARTGQKFSLCILTPEKDHFIRAETKEIISGWLEMLAVYPRTNKQNQKKKRKVEPPTPQEPGPAKVAVTSSSSSIPSAEKVPPTKSTLWQEEMRAKDQSDGSSLSPAQSPSQSQPPAASTLREPGLESRDEESATSSDRVDGGRKVRVESGYFSLEKTKQDVKAEEQQLPPPLSPPSPSAPNTRRSQVIEKFEALDIEKAEHMETNASAGPSPSSDTRQGRSEKRAFPRKRDLPSDAPLPDTSASPLSPHRRAKSLDRRSTESSLTPDLLNFKKGWLTKQYEDGQWKKHWFVLADQSLRFYRDSVAEEAADLDGEIDLSTCCDVTEYPVQRNYGFQIHTKEGAFTLSAMTSGIRRNWIQTIVKHVHPTSAPDVTSSLPQEKKRSSSPLETCPRPRETQDGEPREPDPEQKRSRARERRREGRSKTFDWAEFRPIQQALAQERAGGAPGPPDAHPEAEPGELERERARRREERRKRAEGLGADDAALRMEVDRGPGPPVTTALRTQNVHVEIEQRWHQVETTPLREEKQVPIAPLHLSSEDGGDRLSTHELTSLLEKELEQSQKEASDLLEQNRLLQDQLRVALGREQSAREGYVLQTEVATSPSGAWQRLHRVNQDLHSELEAQCQRQELITQQIQALKRSYGEAKDAIRHHEAEIRSLQARLSTAAAELAIKEQALAKLKGELKLERDKVREQLEERQQSEAALSAQLQASEQKLQSAEALLLGRTQELRDLERQQALQRDRQKEVQRLQERIADLSQQLGASEQAQRLMEEKLQRNYELLLGSCEREKQELLQSLKEAEDRASAFEDRLQDHEQQLEVLQREKLSAKSEGSEAVHRLEEQLEMKEASIQKLAEHVQSLREERDLVRQRFQELLGRMALSDGDVAALQEQLRGREADYRSLEHSYRSVAGQLQGAHTRLQEKEEELRRIRDAHEQALERKEQDLREALVNTAALGSGFEDADAKLRSKDEAFREPDEDSGEPQGPVEGAEVAGGRRAKLEHEAPGEELGDRGPSGEESAAAPRPDGSDREGHPPSPSKPNLGAPGVKRQRIRFSTIQCQKYSHPDGSERTWTSSTSSDTSQDRSPSEESVSSEPPPSSLPTTSDADAYLSIIHSLETKLYVTEEKLKDVTVKLESQQGQSQEALLALHQQWAGTEARLRDQLRASLRQVAALASQLEQERQARAEVVQKHVGELGNFQVKNSQALACLESCREQLRSLPGAGPEDAREAQAGPLASVESLLVGAIQALRHQPAPADGGAQAQPGEGGFSEEGKGTWRRPAHLPEAAEQQQLRLLSDQIALEAALINQISDSLRNTTSDISHILSEVSQSARLPLESGSAEVCPGAPADAWAKKVLVDGEFWNQVESLSKHLETQGGEAAGAAPAQVPARADAAWVRAELSLAAPAVRETLHRRLQGIQETLQGTQMALQQHKRVLGEILGAHQTPDFDRGMQRAPEALGVQAPWAGSPSGELPGHQDRAGSQQPPPWCRQSSGAFVAIQEELALQLKDKAGLLGEISVALASLPSGGSEGDCQELLRASRTRSCSARLGGLGRFSSSLVEGAIAQAQLCYAACRVRLEYEKERQGLQGARPGSGGPCQEHEQAVGALRAEYEELLRQQKSEYLQVIAIVERENAELKARVAQLGQERRRLEEAESEPGARLSAPQGRHEEGVRSVAEQLSRVEGTPQAEPGMVLGQSGAPVGGGQGLERPPVEQVQTLEGRFQLKIRELQTVHEEELRTLQEHYAQTLRCLQETLHHCQGRAAAGEAESVTGLRERIQELEAQLDATREELEHRGPAGSAVTLQEERQRDFESLKATCERGFAAMEETHQKKIEDLQRQHQRELEKLREEKDRLLAEETAATISAIEAMKNAHREEMERELEKSQRSQISSVNSDIEALRRQYLEELQSVQRELEVLSEQYSQKCLENAHLAQALEAERQALRQCQRENQELNAHNQVSRPSGAEPRRPAYRERPRASARVRHHQGGTAGGAGASCCRRAALGLWRPRLVGFLPAAATRHAACLPSRPCTAPFIFVTLFSQSWLLLLRKLRYT